MTWSGPIDIGVGQAHTGYMELKTGMIVKIVLESVVVYGRVLSVDENGDAQVRFNNNGTILVSTVLPEMISEAFYFTGRGRYGV